MLVYLLKSGACLIIFYGFYKLLLEKESIHTFKRFYLLTSVALSFTIPFITFTEYIEVIPQNVPSFYPDIPITNTIIEAEPINYVPIVLWVIYGMGVLLFSIKFIKNLSQLLYRIKHNTKIKTDQYTNVLLQDLIVPHTFFDYIFLNKQKFETHQIPKEVLLHEATHSKQKHSIDVLFIEILQILFWFNPLIYFIKHSIKLNHEFLADQAVLNLGIASSTYQKILLAFSSPDSYRDASNFKFANAINYSSIKKRFTVMKTHTSKQAFWLRSLILLPLLAILIYSFSEKKVIEKPQVFKIFNGEIKVLITKDKKVIIDNETIDFNSISNKLIEITKNDKIKPSVYIEIEGHVDNKYLEQIKNELHITNLKISMIRANAMFLNENEYKKSTKDYFKGVQYTADSMTLINEKGQKFIGVSGPKAIMDTTISEQESDNEEYDIITIKLPRNRGQNLNTNDLGKLDEFVKETFYKKNK
jgi:bla regulator protein BlaR1